MISSVMSTALAKPKAFFSLPQGAVTFRGQAIEQRDNGTALVKDVQIFKSGTFRDSWGDQHTWTPEHLQMMVANFNILKDGGIFGDVPVRRDHSASIDKVMGYFESVRTDGKLLYGDLVIATADDQQNLVNGKYRNVSAEIGMYVTNDETPYWPVIFGVAYVDIPAVEGLHNKSAKVSMFSLTATEESDVTTQAGTPASEGNQSGQTHIHLGIAPSVPSPFSHTVTYSSGTATTPPAAAAPATTDPKPEVPPVHKFRVNGAETVDFAAVQRHIDTMEGTIRTLRDDARKEFVNGLVKTGRIFGAQAAFYQDEVLEMSDERYAKFTASFADSPKLPLLSEHGSSGGHGDAGAPDDPRHDQIEVLEGQLAMFAKAGKTQDWIAKSAPAIALAALKGA